MGAAGGRSASVAKVQDGLVPDLIGIIAFECHAVVGQRMLPEMQGVALVVAINCSSVVTEIVGDVLNSADAGVRRVVACVPPA